MTAEVILFPRVPEALAWVSEEYPIGARLFFDDGEAIVNTRWIDWRGRETVIIMTMTSGTSAGARRSIRVPF